MIASRPILRTSVIGSHAPPGWLLAGLEAAERGELGPADVRELLDDAVDAALRDQEDAGVDVVADGEMRRQGFFTAAFYGRLTGLRALPPDRLRGPAGHDQQHRFEALEPIAAPDGLGVVAEYRYARGRTARPLKVTLPGPFTLAGRLGTGGVYPDRAAAAWAFVPLVNRELRALAGAGARWIQIDEPSSAIRPDSPADLAELFNASVEGLGGDVRIGAHLCFGNYAGRPLARRTYRPVLERMLAFRAEELALEFANRELAELELAGELAAAGRDVAAGLVDVKSYHIETPEDVAARVRRALEYVPAERLGVVPDCGFSETARWAARAKLRAMVEGVRVVRRELAGGDATEADRG